MYLQSLEQVSAAKDENRRRFPRVKPDEFGRFDPDELSPISFEVASEAPKSRKPWLMTVGGAILGMAISVVGVFAVQRQLFSPGVEAHTVEGAKGESPTEAPRPSRSIANPKGMTPHMETPRRFTRDAVIPPSRQHVAPAVAKEELVQRDTRNGPGAPSVKDNLAAQLPAPDTEGSMVPMPGPDNDDDTAALVVLQ